MSSSRSWLLRQDAGVDVGERSWPQEHRRPTLALGLPALKASLSDQGEIGSPCRVSSPQALTFLNLRQLTLSDRDEAFILVGRLPQHPQSPLEIGGVKREQHPDFFPFTNDLQRLDNGKIRQNILRIFIAPERSLGLFEFTVFGPVNRAKQYVAFRSPVAKEGFHQHRGRAQDLRR